MLLIGIGGGTSSGKSTIAKKLVESFDKTGVVRVLSDSYYKDHSNLNISDRSKINFYLLRLGFDIQAEKLFFEKTSKTSFLAIFGGHF